MLESSLIVPYRFSSVFYLRAITVFEKRYRVMIVFVGLRARKQQKVRYAKSVGQTL